jgi:hypothetical protein
MLVGEKIFRLHTLSLFLPNPIFESIFSLLSLLKNPIYMGARIPIIHKVYVKSRDLSRVFRKKISPLAKM